MKRRVIVMGLLAIAMFGMNIRLTNAREKTGEVYYTPEKPSGIEPEDWTWANYVIDSNKGDEFQMNSREGTESFMDILNHKVVCLTEEREYDIDHVDGGEVVSVL